MDTSDLIISICIISVLQLSGALALPLDKWVMFLSVCAIEAVVEVILTPCLLLVTRCVDRNFEPSSDAKEISKETLPCFRVIMFNLIITIILLLTTS